MKIEEAVLALLFRYLQIAIWSRISSKSRYPKKFESPRR